MRTLFISAGHSTKVGSDRGASGNGLIEGVVVSDFRKLLVKELKAIGVPVIVDGDHTVLAETLAWLRRFVNAKSVAIEIHTNAASSGAATGAEVIIPDNPSAFETTFATGFSAIISEVLGIRNRGVKQEKHTARKRLGFMRIPCENILPELFFISNPFDCKAYEANKEELAKRSAAYIKGYL